jgi:hypothetical protein
VCDEMGIKAQSSLDNYSALHQRGSLYYFSLKLMEKLPAKCLCGHKVGDGTHLLVCKNWSTPRADIAAHDVAVRMIGAELNSYRVVVRYMSREPI